MKKMIINIIVVFLYIVPFPTSFFINMWGWEKILPYFNGKADLYFIFTWTVSLIYMICAVESLVTKIGYFEEVQSEKEDCKDY